MAFGHALPLNAPNYGMPAFAMSPEQLQQILVAMRQSGHSTFPAPPGGVPWYPPAPPPPPQASGNPQGGAAAPQSAAQGRPASFRQFKTGFMSKAWGKPGQAPQPSRPEPADRAAAATAAPAAAAAPAAGARPSLRSTIAPVPPRDRHISFPNAGAPHGVLQITCIHDVQYVRDQHGSIPIAGI